MFQTTKLMDILVNLTYLYFYTTKFKSLLYFLNFCAKSNSSTTCILTLTCDTTHAVNVGDSGFVVIRDGVIVYKSEIQQKGFNYPFQLGNGVKLDDPSVAQEIKATVRIGDVIVMATDGLFDNVHNHELEKLVHDSLVDLHKLETFSKMLAQKIAKYALQKSESKTLYTPFSESAPNFTNIVLVASVMTLQ
ncbi:hypothetical protein R3W88_022645 [Solanum pinnatisectum]|uniref:Protein phosphatase n=1 Tax=Solanum pinnatisectum TaxID=50273 RepID=A0AAV9LZ54_9SOLN|nr:hypothetical protein R3W88_022645 [Solanum pinnatisectum]